MKMKHGIFLFLFTIAGALTAAGAAPPYPPSPVIEAISFDWSTHRRDGDFQIANS